jgi:hypothetical protein
VVAVTDLGTVWDISGTNDVYEIDIRFTDLSDGNPLFDVCV